MGKRRIKLKLNFSSYNSLWNRIVYGIESIFSTCFSVMFYFSLTDLFNIVLTKKTSTSRDYVRGKSKILLLAFLYLSCLFFAT